MQPHDDATGPGKLPKTSGQIRAVIKRVHGANTHSASDLPPGNHHQDVGAFVPAAEFKYRASAKYFARQLCDRQVPCEIVRRGGRSFVYVLLVHLDEALAIYKECGRQSRLRTQANIVGNEFSPPEPKSFFSSVQPLLYLVSCLVGAYAMGSIFAATATDVSVATVVAGGAAGLFTWHLLSPMMRRLLVRPPVQEAAADEEDPVEAQTFSWSTLLTTWRSRRSTRSRQAFAPPSETSPF